MYEKKLSYRNINYILVTLPLFIIFIVLNVYSIKHFKKSIYLSFEQELYRESHRTLLFPHEFTLHAKNTRSANGSIRRSDYKFSQVFMVLITRTEKPRLVPGERRWNGEK